ncbi:MAG: 50S ribosomal protein L29 [Planctomycetota bacterium]
MKYDEAKKMTAEEQAVELDRLQRKLFDLRCAKQTEKIESPSDFQKLRRDIARLKTAQRERSLAEERS